MVWPAQSPDLNPIEHIWVHLKKKLAEYETSLNEIHELWERIQVDWEGILAKDCQNLIKSMPRRVQAVLKAKGGYTKYQILCTLIYLIYLHIFISSKTVAMITPS